MQTSPGVCAQHWAPWVWCPAVLTCGTSTAVQNVPEASRLTTAPRRCAGRNDNSGTRTNADSSSGTGAAGERRSAHIDGNGYHASARTSGTGPHHESVHTSTRRMPGGGISRTVRASATSTG